MNIIEQITESNIASEDIFEKIYNSKDRVKTEREYFEKAKKFRCLSNVKKEYEKFTKRYIDTYSQLDFGVDAPIRTMYCGQYKIENNNILDSKNQLVCSQLFEPICIFKNYEEDTERIQCAFKDNGKWVEFITDKDILYNKNRIVSLTKKGLDVSTENAASMVKYIQTIINKNKGDLPIRKSINHMGWCNNNFVPYDEDVACDSFDEYKQKFECITTKGDYKNWLEYMYKLRNNKIVRIMHDTCFASVLLSRLGRPPYILICWGRSGDGKTVAAMTGMSIFGNPKSKERTNV